MPRRIVITGAGRGIGLGLVERLAATGDEVWGTVRNDAAEQAARAAGAHRVERLDLGDQSSIEAFGALVRDAVDSIDVLINNAGLNSGALGVEDRRAQGPLLTTGPVVLRQIEVNAVGPMLLTQQLHPLLLAAEHPVVFNVSSQLGSMEVGGRSTADLGYNASKSVMNMVTVMSATADPNVCHVAVHPGWVQSDMGGPSAAVTIDDSVAGLVSVLDGLTLEDSGRFLTWQGAEHPW